VLGAGAGALVQSTQVQGALVRVLSRSPQHDSTWRERIRNFVCGA
jgi:hypothetical protein